MTRNDLKQLLIELASETEKMHPIDWNRINLSRDAVYSLVAEKTTDFYVNKVSNLNVNEQIIVLLSTVLNLSVQTFMDEYVRLKEEHDE